MTVWDAPNQQVVRPDESPPWEEGTGGSEGGEVGGGPTSSDSLRQTTKADLLAQAEEAGVEADESMTKAEIAEAIEAG